MQRRTAHSVTASDSRGSARAVIRICVVATLLASLIGVLPAPRTAFAVDQQYQLTNTQNGQLSAIVGTTFNEPVGVRVSQRTIAGNPFVNGIPITFTVQPAQNGASGTFAGGLTSVTVVSSDLIIQNTVNPGVATAPAFTANDIVGSYTIKVVAQEPTPENAVPYFFFMNNISSSINKAFLISAGDGSLQATKVNTTYQTPFFATVLNGNNALLPGVTVTFTAPESGPSGVFTSTGTRIATGVTNSNGFVVSPPFRANDIQGGYSVTASVSADQTTSGEEISTSYGLRNSITDTLGVPETVSASAGSGQQVSVATTLPTNLQVAVFDGSLDHVINATVTFTLPETGPSGTFSNGLRTFTTSTNGEGLATALPLTTNLEVGPISVAVVATKDGISASTNLVVVNGKVLTTTTLTKSPTGNSVYGQPLVLTATVRATEGAYVPTGPVEFKQGGVTITGCANVSPSAGVATCTLNWLEPGNYSYSADYKGDAVSEISSSSTLNHTVIKASTTTAIETSHPTFVLEGETVTFTVTVSPVAPGAAQFGEPTGTMAFTASDGTILNGGNPVAVVNGVASISTSDLQVGLVTITAVYSGDSHFVGSENSYVQHVYTIPEVTQDPEDILRLVGETVTFTAAASGFPTPTVQWQVSTDNGQSFTDIANATSTTLSFTAAPDQDQNQYRAVFTNAAGFDTTLAATLTVRQPPSFTSASTATFTVGESGSFTVTADGILPPSISLTTGTLPDNVEFDPETGILSGTPLDGTGGEYPLTFTASNEIDPDAVQSFTLYVTEAPEFTSEPDATFLVGQMESFQFTADGYPAATFSTVDLLPDGISLSAAGVLSGTPTTPGVYTFTVAATNGIGDDASQTFTLTINETPAFSSSTATTFTVGEEGAFTVTVTGYPTPEMSVSGTLPTGVSFDPETGVLSGTPADGTGGEYTLTFSATNVVTTTDQIFTLTVNEAPEITSADATTFVVGTAGTFTVTADGFPVSTFSVTGDLPTGVSLSSDGVLSGTPADGTGGTYTLTIGATNGIGTAASQEFTLTVDEAPEISSDDATTFVVGQEGNFTVVADGYPAVTFSLEGALPEGVTFTSAGVLSGTPAEESGASYTVTITASNGVSPDAVQSFTLTVNEAPEITSVAETTFTVGMDGSYTIVASGFPDATFSTTGTLPTGVSLDASGILSGTPADGTGGVYTFDVVAANGILPDATQSFTLTVNEAPEITSAASATFQVGQLGSFNAMANGFPTATFSLQGTLPGGVTLAPGGVLSGTPTDGSGGVYEFTIVASNGVDPDAEQTFTLTVNEAPAFTSDATASFDLEFEGSFSVTADGYPQATFSTSGPLPNGVTLTSGGILSGTATEGGTFTFTIVASNGINPDASQPFTLTVLVPTIVTPNNLTVPNDTGFAGAIVNYPAPVTIGRVGDVTCNPPAGSFFNLGPTTVNCVSSLSPATASFTVTVVDKVKPVITPPANILALPTSGNGANVTYPNPIVTDNAPGVTFTCTPPSGSHFPVGPTRVTCTATDTSGNTASATFTVTVGTAAILLPELSNLIDNLQINGSPATQQSLRNVLQGIVDGATLYSRGRTNLMSCMQMSVFDAVVNTQVRRGLISARNATPLLTMSNAIRISLNCGSGLTRR